MKRLVLSDLHLGSMFSQEKTLIKLLNQIEFDELILAGDIIEFLKIPSFTEDTHEIFQIFSDIKKPIVYVVGNHDISFEKFIGSSIKNIYFTEKYKFTVQERNFVIEHGDKYGKKLMYAKYLMPFVALVGDVLERGWGYNTNAVADWYMNRKPRVKRIWNIMEKNLDADVFIMGHTHMPEALIWIDSNEKIRTYVNIGDWVEHTTYVYIDGPQVRLKNFSNEGW
tara:strand:- start:370 stop:1041 length:672 start_codon:yes stop_codon:yes gene_type:complete